MPIMNKVRNNYKTIMAVIGIVVSCVFLSSGSIIAMADPIGGSARTEACPSDSSGTWGTINWKITGVSGDCTLNIGPGTNSDSAPTWKTDGVNKIVIQDPADTHFVGNTYGMFRSLDLDSIEGLNGADFSQVDSMRYMFQGLNYNGVLDLSGIDTSKVTDMDDMFKNFKADGIKGLDTLDTSSVTTMHEMFYGADLGDSVLDVSKFNTSKVENLSDVFYDTKAADITGFEHWDTSSAETIDGVVSTHFNKTVDLSSWNVKNVQYLTYTFSGLTAKGLDLSNWNLEKAELFEDMLSDMNLGDGELNVTGWEIAPKCDRVTSSCDSGPKMDDPFRNAEFGTVVGYATWKYNQLPTVYDINYWPKNQTRLDMEGLDHYTISSESRAGDCFFADRSKVTSSSVAGWDMIGREPKYINTMMTCSWHDKNTIDVDMSNVRLNPDYTSSGNTFKLPVELRKLTIGDETKLADESMSAVNPTLTEEEKAEYTGKWAEVNSGPDDHAHQWESTSSDPNQAAIEIAARSREGGHGGTYVLQRKINVKYDKNTTDEVTEMPDNTYATWPSVNGGVKAAMGPKRAGYVFEKWTTNQDGSGLSYNVGDIVNVTSEVTLYAQWKKVILPGLKFDGNGNTSGTAPDKITGEAGSSVKIPCKPGLGRDGATFIGWSYSKSAVLAGENAGDEGKVVACGYSDKDTLTLPNEGDTTLYAVWAANPKLVFEDNKPKDMDSLLPETEKVSANWWLPGSDKSYVNSMLKNWTVGWSPDGVHKFDGWVNEDGTPFNGTYLDRKDIVVKAKWSKIDTTPDTVTATSQETQGDPVDESTNTDGTTKPDDANASTVESNQSSTDSDPADPENTTNGNASETAQAPSANDVTNADPGNGDRVMAKTGAYVTPAILVIIGALVMGAAAMMAARRKNK